MLNQIKSFFSTKNAQGSVLSINPVDISGHPSDGSEIDIVRLYGELTCMGFVRGQNHFSTEFLGKSKRYYSVLLATKRQPSIQAQISLAVKLRKLSDEQYVKGSFTQSEALYGMSRSLWKYISRVHI